MSTAVSVATLAANRYVPRGRNELYTIFERHFDDFCEQYDGKYGATFVSLQFDIIKQRTLEGVLIVSTKNPNLTEQIDLQVFLQHIRCEGPICR